jgi:hypothetical protein
MDRCRDQGYERVKGYLKDRKIDGLCILHLRQCFDVTEVTPIDNLETKVSCSLYDNDLDKDVQDKLSKVRTDLDSFNEKESYSLMNSGYQMMSKWLETIKTQQPVWSEFRERTREDWEFLKIKDVVENDKYNLLNLLENSKSLFFKVGFKEMYRWCYIFPLVIGLIFLYACCTYPLILLSFVGAVFILFIVLYKFSENSLYSLIKYVTKPVLWSLAKFNLNCMNEKYLQKGEIE